MDKGKRNVEASSEKRPNESAKIPVFVSFIATVVKGIAARVCVSKMRPVMAFCPNEENVQKLVSAKISTFICIFFHIYGFIWSQI